MPIEQPPEGMIAFTGGQFVMGSDHHYLEEKPARVANVAPFAMDRYAVTNSQFASFVEETGYITTAERVGSTASQSMVFRMTDGPVSLLDPSQWWTSLPGACWHSPEGPDSSILDRMDHPVVQVSYEDAATYAEWTGKRLPTEMEWEFAASLSFDMREVLASANIWRGEFPYRNDRREEPPFTVAATAETGRPEVPANLIGNVWEWTSSGFDTAPENGCCSGVGTIRQLGLLVLKGGSFLCAESYCRRYRPQARIGQHASYSASHIGFRCVADLDASESSQRNSSL